MRESCTPVSNYFNFFVCFKAFEVNGGHLILFLFTLVPMCYFQAQNKEIDIVWNKNWTSRLDFRVILQDFSFFSTN